MDAEMIKEMVEYLCAQSTKITSIEKFLYKKFEEAKAGNFSKYDSKRACCEFNIKVISALLGTNYYENEEGIYVLKELQDSNDRALQVKIDQIEKYIYIFEFISYSKKFGIYVDYQKNINVDDFRKVLESAITKPLGIESFRNIVAMAKDIEERRRTKLRNKRVKKWFLIIGGITLSVDGVAIVASIANNKKDNNDGKKSNDDDVDINCSFAMIIPDNDDIVIFPSDKGDVIISKSPSGDINIDTAGDTDITIDNIGDTDITILNTGDADILILNNGNCDTTVVSPSHVSILND